MKREPAWDPAVLARMRAIAQAPKPEADEAEARRPKRPTPKRKPKKGSAA
jgi:hypothetical protein